MRSVTLTPTRKPGNGNPLLKIRADVPPIRQTSFRHAERKRLQHQLEEQSSNDGRQNLNLPHGGPTVWRRRRRWNY